MFIPYSSQWLHNITLWLHFSVFNQYAINDYSDDFFRLCYYTQWCKEYLCGATRSLCIYVFSVVCFDLLSEYPLNYCSVTSNKSTLHEYKFIDNQKLSTIGRDQSRWWSKRTWSSLPHEHIKNIPTCGIILTEN